MGVLVVAHSRDLFVEPGKLCLRFGGEIALLQPGGDGRQFFFPFLFPFGHGAVDLCQAGLGFGKLLAPGLLFFFQSALPFQGSYQLADPGFHLLQRSFIGQLFFEDGQSGGVVFLPLGNGAVDLL